MICFFSYSDESEEIYNVMYNTLISNLVYVRQCNSTNLPAWSEKCESSQQSIPVSTSCKIRVWMAQVYILPNHQIKNAEEQASFM